MEATIVLYCQQVFGFDRVHAGLMFAALGVLMALVQGGMVGPLTRRFGDARLLATGILLIAAGLLLLPAARPPLLAALVVAGCLLAVGAGLHNASSLGLLSQLAGDDEQGQTFGWSRSFAALARVLGPLLGTWSFRHLGKTWPFWIAGTLALAGLAWSGALLRRLGTARRSEVAAASEPA
jgi:MFS family permease